MLPKVRNLENEGKRGQIHGLFLLSACFHSYPGNLIGLETSHEEWKEAVNVIINQIDQMCHKSLTSCLLFLRGANNLQYGRSYDRCYE